MDMNTLNRQNAYTFTGHRPERLELPENQVIRWLTEQIRQAADEGCTDFITGMQRGVDIWAAEAVLKLRDEGASVRLIAACPFPEMESRWERVWQERYSRIISAADMVYIIGSKPGRQAFFERNRWMVDHASRLIAVYTGAPGGTKETISYAREKGLKVICIRKDERSGEAL